MKNILEIIKNYMDIFFGYKNIESSYKIFIKLFSIFCDVVKFLFYISAFIIFIALFSYNEKNEIYFAIGIWFASFIAFYGVIGLMSTLVVIAERLKAIEIKSEHKYNLLKIIITKTQKATYTTLVTSFGEGRYKYCEGYAILSTKEGTDQVIVRKIPIAFEEVLMYEYAITKDKRVGRGVIDLKKDSGSHINIKVPPNSVIFNKEADLDITSWTLVADGKIKTESNELVIYDIQDFMMTEWQNFQIKDFDDALNNLSKYQNFDEANNIINELKLSLVNKL